MRRGDLYWHFRECWSAYAIALACLALFIFIGWGNYALSEKISANEEVVREWPLVEAAILKKKLSIVSGGSKSFQANHYVTLEVEYRYDGKLIRADVRGHGAYGHPLKGEKVFQVGKKVPLRVHPDDPEMASLIELTGNL